MPTGTSHSTPSRRRYPLDTWVNFKVWGGIGLFLVFALAQGVCWRATPSRRRHEREGRAASTLQVHADVAGTLRGTRSASLVAQPSSKSPTTAASTWATPAPPAAAGTFPADRVRGFSGLPRLARHQRVLREVADLLPHPVHALSIKALTPENFLPDNPNHKGLSPMIRTYFGRSPSLVALTALPARAGATRAPPRPPAPATGCAPPAAAARQGALPARSTFDFLLKERIAQGQPDTPELRTSMREELNTRELLVREAKKKGLDKNPDVKNQMDLDVADGAGARLRRPTGSRRTRFRTRRCKRNTTQIKSQMGDKEYKVRHILVEKEDEAKEIIVAAAEGREVREARRGRSKDPGSKDKGGDLDWNAPSNFVKPFSDAMVKTPKGKFTTHRCRRSSAGT